MKKTLLIGGLLAALAAGILFLVNRPPPPPVFAEVGGTLLVYEYQLPPDQQAKLASDEITTVITKRLDPAGLLGVEARVQPPGRIEIRIPRGPGDHAAQVEEMKALLRETGHLEFRVLANAHDDAAAIAAAHALFETVAAEELDKLAQLGLPPPSPRNPDQERFYWSTEFADGWATYSWVELGRTERENQGLQNAAERDPDGKSWQEAAAARAEGKPLVFGSNSLLLYSRPCVDRNLLPEAREDKRFEYFFLTRNPIPAKALTGKYLVQVKEAIDYHGEPALNFTFNDEGGELMHELTTANRRLQKTTVTFAKSIDDLSQEPDRIRSVAVILDGVIMTAPTVISPIREVCQIGGPKDTNAEVRRMVRILRSGALPVTLTLDPVLEEVVPLLAR